MFHQSMVCSHCWYGLSYFYKSAKFPLKTCSDPNVAKERFSILDAGDMPIPGSVVDFTNEDEDGHPLEGDEVEDEAAASLLRRASKEFSNDGRATSLLETGSSTITSAIAERSATAVEAGKKKVETGSGKKKIIVSAHNFAEDEQNFTRSKVGAGVGQGQAPRDAATAGAYADLYDNHVSRPVKRPFNQVVRPRVATSNSSKVSPQISNSNTPNTNSEHGQRFQMDKVFDMSQHELNSEWVEPLKKIEDYANLFFRGGKSLRQSNSAQSEAQKAALDLLTTAENIVNTNDDSISRAQMILKRVDSEEVGVSNDLQSPRASRCDIPSAQCSNDEIRAFRGRVFNQQRGQKSPDSSDDCFELEPTRKSYWMNLLQRSPFLFVWAGLYFMFTMYHQIF